MEDNEYKLGIIGAGKIGQALISGVFANGLYKQDELILSVRTEEHRKALESKFQVATTLDNRKIAAQSKLIVLSVKPKSIIDIVNSIADSLKPGSVIISTAAGVPLEVIESRVPEYVGVIRTMPNLAIAVGEGMTALAPGKNAKPDDVEATRQLFGSVGRALVLEEQQMDAVTGLSGSGPAYIYIVIESLADGGVKLGLSREVATELAAQTVLGAAKTVLASGEHPAKLKDEVTTPSGSTIEGILELEEGGLRVTLIKAVVKAAERSRELLRNQPKH